MAQAAVAYQAVMEELAAEAEAEGTHRPMPETAVLVEAAAVATLLMPVVRFYRVAEVLVAEAGADAFLLLVPFLAAALVAVEAVPLIPIQTPSQVAQAAMAWCFSAIPRATNDLRNLHPLPHAIGRSRIVSALPADRVPAS